MSFNQYLLLFIFLTITVVVSWLGKYRLSIVLFFLFLIASVYFLLPHFHTHYALQY